MHASAVLLFALLAHASALQSSGVTTSPSAPDCREWHECRERAIEAVERRQYETFHDLAWRAVQTGPRNDSALLYLLARAQSLSGRPHDALIMLQRLADMGVPSDASTNDDFARVRTLAGWPEIEALIERVRTAAAAIVPAPPTAATPSATASPAPAPPKAVTTKPAASTRARSATKPVASTPAPAVATPAPPAATPAPAISKPAPPPPAPSEPALPSFTPRFEPAPVEQAARISTPRFSAGGLAYDAASGRFVIGDQHGRKLFVVEDGADHPVDLVRAESAGFQEIRAIEIDSRRGDLWVATANGDDGQWSIHHVQLISGRPLKALPIDVALGPTRLVDLAVSRGGTLLALDAAGKRLLELRPKETSLRPVPIGVDGPTSLATTDDEEVVYVAGAEGVARMDLKSGMSVQVSLPPGLEIGTIERIRWHRQALLAVQIDGTGARRLVRFDLNVSGRAVTGATVIDQTIAAAAGHVFLTLSGDLLSYVVTETEPPSRPEDAPSDRPTEFIIRRIHLR